MTKDEIKKGLKCCETDWCVRCPYFECIGCEVGLKQDALTLITEQEKEIKRLRTTLGQCNTELNSALESLKSQCREIGELKAKIKQAQIDILNYLKEKCKFDGHTVAVYKNDIDELIKEIEEQ